MPTTNQVPSQSPTDLLFNAQKLDEVVSGTSAYYTDRLGVNRRTIEGINAAADVVLAGLGYAPPVVYAVGISLTLATQTVEYSGEVYAPKVADLPFTTSGTFETAKFRLIQGVASADLALSSGASLVGYDGGTVQDVMDGAVSKQDYVALRAYTGRANRIYITGLLVTEKPAGIAGAFQYDPTDTTSLDDGGTIIEGADGRRWKRDYAKGHGVVDWFDTKGGSIDDTAVIQKALDAGFATLSFTKQKYTVSAAEGSEYCLILSKNTDLIGLGGPRKAIIEGALSGTTTPSVLKIEITDAGAYGDVRHWRMRGLAIYPVGGGKHGVLISGSGAGAKQISTSSIKNSTMAGRTVNGGYALYIENNIANCKFEGNTFENGVYAKCYDGNLFTKNTTFGTGCAFTFDCIDGVRNNTVKDNVTVNRDGIVRIINGDNIRIINNQMEQMLGYTPPQNQNAVSAMVWLEGVDRPIYNTVIRENNFGGGTNVNYLVYVDNAQKTIIDDNQVISANIAEVYFTSKSKYNILGPKNRTKESILGPRPRKLFKANVIDNGFGNMGTLKKGSALSTQNGWVGADFYKDEYGIIRFIGEFSLGSTTPGSVIGTVPDGFRPYFQGDAVKRNLLTYTEDLSNSAWYKTYASIAIDSSVSLAPDGVQSADIITAEGTDSVARFVLTPKFDVAASTQHAESFYLKRVSTSTSNIVRFEINDDSTLKVIRGTIDLTTGAVTSTFSTTYFSAVSATSVLDVDGWWRVKVTLTTTASGASSTYAIGVTPNNVASIYTPYVGDPAVHQVLAWGYQAEQNSTVTPYQRVVDADTFETVFAAKNFPAMTSYGLGYVGISRQGVITVGSLPSNERVVVDAFQAADTE